MSLSKSMSSLGDLVGKSMNGKEPGKQLAQKAKEKIRQDIKALDKDLAPPPSEGDTIETEGEEVHG